MQDGRSARKNLEQRRPRWLPQMREKLVVRKYRLDDVGADERKRYGLEVKTPEVNVRSRRRYSTKLKSKIPARSQYQGTLSLSQSQAQYSVSQTILNANRCRHRLLPTNPRLYGNHAEISMAANAADYHFEVSSRRNKRRRVPILEQASMAQARARQQAREAARDRVEKRQLAKSNSTKSNSSQSATVQFDSSGGDAFSVPPVTTLCDMAFDELKDLYQRMPSHLHIYMTLPSVELHICSREDLIGALQEISIALNNCKDQRLQ